MNSKNWERFTQRARRVLSLAQEEAERLNHSYIGSEHVLIGLLLEEGGVAGRVLRELGLEVTRVQAMVERLSGGQAPAPHFQRQSFPPAPSVSSNTRLKKPGAWGNTISARSTCSSVWRAKTKDWPLTCCASRHQRRTDPPPNAPDAEGKPRLDNRDAAAATATPAAATTGQEREEQDAARRPAGNRSDRSGPGIRLGPGHRPPNRDRARHPDSGPAHEE